VGTSETVSILTSQPPWLWRAHSAFSAFSSAADTAAVVALRSEPPSFVAAAAGFLHALDVPVAAPSFFSTASPRAALASELAVIFAPSATEDDAA